MRRGRSKVVQTMNAIHVKVFLYAYPRLGALAEASERAAENKAALSFRSLLSTFDACAEVAEEFSMADRLLELRRQLGLILGDLTREERFLLEYKFFRRRKMIASFADMVPSYSMRTYFRKQNSLLKKIRSRLMFLGWSDARYDLAFGAYRPFVQMERALAEGRERASLPPRKGMLFFQSSASPRSEERLLPLRAKTATPTAAAQAIQMTTICTVFSPPPLAAELPSTDPEGTLKKSSLRS